MKLNERIEIEWLDIVDDSSWVEYTDAVKVPTDVYCKSVGYFLKENDQFIWLSPTIGRNRRGSRSFIIIPKGTVQKIRKLVIKRKRNAR